MSMCPTRSCTAPKLVSTVAVTPPVRCSCKAATADVWFSAFAATLSLRLCLNRPRLSTPVQLRPPGPCSCNAFLTSWPAASELPVLRGRHAFAPMGAGRLAEGGAHRLHPTTLLPSESPSRMLIRKALCALPLCCVGVHCCLCPAFRRCTRGRWRRTLRRTWATRVRHCLCLVVSLPSWLRHCLHLVSSLPSRLRHGLCIVLTLSSWC